MHITGLFSFVVWIFSIGLLYADGHWIVGTALFILALASDQSKEN